MMQPLLKIAPPDVQTVLRCAQVLATCLEARATEMAVADLAKVFRASGGCASTAPCSLASLRRQRR